MKRRFSLRVFSSFCHRQLLSSHHQGYVSSIRVADRDLLLSLLPSTGLFEMGLVDRSFQAAATQGRRVPFATGSLLSASFVCDCTRGKATGKHNRIWRIGYRARTTCFGPQESSLRKMWSFRGVRTWEVKYWSAREYGALDDS